MKRIIHILCLIIVQNITAQESPVNSGSIVNESNAKGERYLTGEELKQAANMYLEMMKSASFKEAVAARERFRAKQPPLKIPEDMEEFRTWMTWNLSKTKFSSANEAVEMYQNYMDLFAKQIEEYKELFELTKRASPKQIKIIFQSEYSRQAPAQTNQPGLSDQEFLKAKDQFYEMYHSEPFQNKNKVEKEVIKRIAGKIPIEYMDEVKWRDWLSLNLKSTTFVSVEEGVNLRKRNLELIEIVVGENEELFELMTRATPEQITQIAAPERK